MHYPTARCESFVETHLKGRKAELRPVISYEVTNKQWSSLFSHLKGQSPGSIDSWPLPSGFRPFQGSSKSPVYVSSRLPSTKPIVMPLSCDTRLSKTCPTLIGKAYSSGIPSLRFERETNFHEYERWVDNLLQPHMLQNPK